MLIIRRPSSDPLFNLATEEYLLKNVDEETFSLWRNEPSIVVGKHQNTLAEINVAYVKKHKIPVVRRISGGGTVYHDLGNLNFTFTGYPEEKNRINFRKGTQPVLDFLRSIGINAHFRERSDLVISGRKFSGNAMHLWRNKFLHHGTLLFSTEIQALSEALRVNPSGFRDKAVRSTRSQVTNLRDHLPQPMDIRQFTTRMEQFMAAENPSVAYYQLTGNDVEGIRNLVKTKYATWDWNFGYSPGYNFSKRIQTRQSGTIEINLEVHDGVIEQVGIFGDFFGIREPGELQRALTGVLHREDTIRMVLESFEIEKYFANLSPQELLEGFF